MLLICSGRLTDDKLFAIFLFVFFLSNIHILAFRFDCQTDFHPTTTSDKQALIWRDNDTSYAYLTSGPFHRHQSHHKQHPSRQHHHHHYRRAVPHHHHQQHLPMPQSSALDMESSRQKRNLLHQSNPLLNTNYQWYSARSYGSHYGYQSDNSHPLPPPGAIPPHHSMYSDHQRVLPPPIKILPIENVTASVGRNAVLKCVTDRPTINVKVSLAVFTCHILKLVFII